MRVKHTAEGTYTLTCDEGELSLIAEGLYAVQDTGKRCLDRGIPDEFDAPVLAEELRQLADMRLTIAGAMGTEPVFRIIDGGQA